MKKLYILIVSSFFCNLCFSQNYSLNPTNLNIKGNPGDLLLSTLIVNNTSNFTIKMHLKRTVKNLPPKWTSCFCFPNCIAPFIDTMTFSIAPFSLDSIKPNFGTDSTERGIGYVTITLFEDGFQNKVDTISFSGSTLTTTAINSFQFRSKLNVFPNPFHSILTIQNDNAETYSICMYNSAGVVIYRNESLKNSLEKIDLSFLNEGLYYIRTEFSSGKIIANKIIKSTNN